MSANRAVQAAQRRRAGPPDPQPPGRGPQPSIHSAQAFYPQQPPAVGGRLAGQHHAQLQQQQHQQRYQQQQQQQRYSAPQNQYQEEPATATGIHGISKMTISQAITLITLRLGAVETKLMEMEHNPSSHTLDTASMGTDAANQMWMSSMVSRLEAIEKRSTVNPESALRNQSMDKMNQAFKTQMMSLKKENEDLRQQLMNQQQWVQQQVELICSYTQPLDDPMEDYVEPVEPGQTSLAELESNESKEEIPSESPEESVSLSAQV